MLNVNHKITIGSDVWSSTENSRLRRLVCSSSLDVPVNTCYFEFGYPEGVNVKPEDTIEVELGHGDEMEMVFTGFVESVNWNIRTVQINAASSFARLAKARLNLVFEKSKAGSIVSDVCNELDVDTGTVQPGLEFAFYYLGDGSTAYDHLKYLADQNGFSLYADEQDKLNFLMPVPGNVHLFQYGVNVLSLETDTPQALLTGVDLYGLSPASFGQGPDSSSWFTKKEVKGAAGSSGGIKRQVFDPTARSQQNALQIANNLLNAGKAVKKGVLKILGASDIRIGEMANVSGMPVGEHNGTYSITGVKHAINGKKGYVTTIEFE